MIVKHNHPLYERCDEVGCTQDRYLDGRHVFTDVTVETTVTVEEGTVVSDGNQDLIFKDLGNADSQVVGEVIDRRRQVYGEPSNGFPRIAQVWSGILGHEVSALDVPLMLIGLKAVRTQITPDYSDNSDDIEGFLAIFRELVGEDMVHARLVSEYIEKKYGDG